MNTKISETNQNPKAACPTPTWDAADAAPITPSAVCRALAVCLAGDAETSSRRTLPFRATPTADAPGLASMYFQFGRIALGFAGAVVELSARPVVLGSATCPEERRFPWVRLRKSAAFGLCMCGLWYDCAVVCLGMYRWTGVFFISIIFLRIDFFYFDCLVCYHHTMSIFKN